MNRKVMRIAVATLAGVFVITGSSSAVFAKTNRSVTGERSLGGFSLYIDQYYTSLDKVSEISKADTTSLLAEKTIIPQNIAIANVNDRLNIRNKPSTEGEIVGYLPSDAHCVIRKKAGDGWVEIKSGDVVGYTRLEYLYSEEKGRKKAEEVGTLKATVEGNGINLRSEPFTGKEDNVITKLQEGEQFAVLDEVVFNKDDDNAPVWVKINYKGEEAFTSRNLVKLSYQWDSAEKVVPLISPEVSAASPTKLAVEPQAAPSQQITSSQPKGSSSTTNGVRQNIIKAAEGALGLKYTWAGNSLQTGADCSGYVLASYRAAGIDTSKFSRSSKDIAVSSAGRTISRSELQVGDFVFYGKKGVVNHVAMYYGNGKIIHESSFEGKAIISSLDYSTPMKYRNFLD